MERVMRATGPLPYMKRGKTLFVGCRGYYGGTRWVDYYKVGSRTMFLSISSGGEMMAARGTEARVQAVLDVKGFTPFLLDFTFTEGTS
jgi:hypothetical protein